MHYKRWFRTPLICSLITGFSCESSTNLGELANVASYILDKNVNTHDMSYAESGIRNECMAVVLEAYPNLPTEYDIARYGIDHCVEEAISLYGRALEI